MNFSGLFNAGIPTGLTPSFSLGGVSASVVDG